MNFAITQLSLNTCKRKIHFLTQIYWETKLFGTTYEGSSNNYEGGNFYQGRGFLQLTGKTYNYIPFYKSIYFTEPDAKTLEKFVSTIATSMEWAMKSAIWYWKTNKINDYADQDDVDRVSAAVNFPQRLKEQPFTTNGMYGVLERRRYCFLFKSIFDYENCDSN